MAWKGFQGVFPPGFAARRGQTARRRGCALPAPTSDQRPG